MINIKELEYQFSKLTFDYKIRNVVDNIKQHKEKSKYTQKLINHYIRKGNYNDDIINNFLENIL